MARERVKFHVKRLQQRIEWVNDLTQLKWRMVEFISLWRNDFGTSENIPEEVIDIFQKKMDELMQEKEED